MGIGKNLATKSNIVATINKVIDSRNGKTGVTGYWLNVILRAIIDLFYNGGVQWSARISQSGVTAPVLSPGWDGSGGVILADKFDLGLVFEYISAGTYKVTSTFPVFEDINKFGVTFQNNKIVDVGGIVSYGEVYITHDPANPYSFFINTFDGINGGIIADDLLDNCLMSICYLPPVAL